MTGGADLLGAVPEKRGRGRPKGSKNRRSGDLTAYLGAVYGGSTAQQTARFCLVTPKAVREAGGSVAQAYVNQALDLSRRARDADAQLVEEVEALILQAAARLALGGKGVGAAVDAICDRLLRRAEPLPLATALDMLNGERAKILPYTDQKRPQAVDLTPPAQGGAPVAVIVMGGVPGAGNETLDQQGFGDMMLGGPVIEGEPLKANDQA